MLPAEPDFTSSKMSRLGDRIDPPPGYAVGEFQEYDIDTENAVNDLPTTRSPMYFRALKQMCQSYIALFSRESSTMKHNEDARKKDSEHKREISNIFLELKMLFEHIQLHRNISSKTIFKQMSSRELLEY